MPGMEATMHEFKVGSLRSGKPGPGKGPKVTKRSQAIAIGLRESGKAKPKPKADTREQRIAKFERDHGDAEF